MQMKLYGISGLGADKRVFEHLSLDCAFIPIEWIEPLKNEPIEDYSIRLSKAISQEEDFGIIGVSFGGLVAVEISKRLKSKLTILVSSVETRLELRRLYRIIGKTTIIKRLPQFLFDPPRVIAHWLFGARHKKLLNQILDDTDLNFAKWAVNQLTKWKNEERLSNPILKIVGARDKLIPPSKDDSQQCIVHGEHFMIVDRATEISLLINERIKKMNK